MTKVDVIKLRIGEMRQVVADSLLFGFECLTKNTPLENARIEIENIPITARCMNANRNFELRTGCQFVRNADVARLRSFPEKSLKSLSLKDPKHEVECMKVSLVTNILKANERIADQNRKFFDEKGILVLNMMSAPGAGKTTIISKTIVALEKEFRIGVIEGDIQSTYDAEKISETGAQVVQINTGGACHLDGNMIRETFDDLDLDAIDILIVENVGNLVCPAEFNVGEDFKVMLLSVRREMTSH